MQNLFNSLFNGKKNIYNDQPASEMEQPDHQASFYQTKSTSLVQQKYICIPLNNVTDQSTILATTPYDTLEEVMTYTSQFQVKNMVIPIIKCYKGQFSQGNYINHANLKAQTEENNIQYCLAICKAKEQSTKQIIKIMVFSLGQIEQGKKRIQLHFIQEFFYAFGFSQNKHSKQENLEKVSLMMKAQNQTIALRKWGGWKANEYIFRFQNKSDKISSYFTLLQLLKQFYTQEKQTYTETQNSLVTTPYKHLNFNTPSKTLQSDNIKQPFVPLNVNKLWSQADHKPRKKQNSYHILPLITSYKQSLQPFSKAYLTNGQKSSSEEVISMECSVSLNKNSSQCSLQEQNQKNMKKNVEKNHQNYSQTIESFTQIRKKENWQQEIDETYFPYQSYKFSKNSTQTAIYRPERFEDGLEVQKIIPKRLKFLQSQMLAQHNQHELDKVQNFQQMGLKDEEDQQASNKETSNFNKLNILEFLLAQDKRLIFLTNQETLTTINIVQYRKQEKKYSLVKEFPLDKKIKANNFTICPFNPDRLLLYSTNNVERVVVQFNIGEGRILSKHIIPSLYRYPGPILQLQYQYINGPSSSFFALSQNQICLYEKKHKTVLTTIYSYFHKNFLKNEYTSSASFTCFAVHEQGNWITLADKSSHVKTFNTLKCKKEISLQQKKVQNQKMQQEKRNKKTKKVKKITKTSRQNNKNKTQCLNFTHLKALNSYNLCEENNLLYSNSKQHSAMKQQNGVQINKISFVQTTDGPQLLCESNYGQKYLINCVQEQNISIFQHRLKDQNRSLIKKFSPKENLTFFSNDTRCFELKGHSQMINGFMEKHRLSEVQNFKNVDILTAKIIKS